MELHDERFADHGALHMPIVSIGHYAGVDIQQFVFEFLKLFWVAGSEVCGLLWILAQVSAARSLGSRLL